MGIFLVLLSIGAIIYFIVRHNKKKSDKKYQEEIDYRKNVAPDVDIYSDESFKKQITFRYKDWDDKTYTKKIIPFYRNERFLEGYNLETFENDLFEIDKIVSFQDGSRKRFDELDKDPSILSHEETDNLPAKNHAPITKDKSHKNWDEKNPIEIFIRYENASGERKDRVIRLINYESNSITAHCKTANSMRTFRIDRIRTFYKDSKDRLESFKTNPHFNRELLTISFLGFADNVFNQYKQQGEIYNFRALKSVSKNTSIIVTNKELTESQQKRADENHCAFIAPENFLHFLKTGEVQSGYQD